MPKIFVALLSAVLLTSAAPVGAQVASHTVSEPITVTNPDDGTEIVLTTFQPAGSGPGSEVPVILHSHGWGGSRTSTITTEFQAFLDAGFGIVSFDQRGFGASSGEANIQDPEMETEDVKAVIDYIATLDWVQHDTDAAGAPIADDPVLGAIGGSYGGGYQTMTLLDEMADEGRTRFNAIAPEITWFDLPESLAPQAVPRTAWTTALYAAGASALPQYVHEGFAWGAATGQWPDGTTYGQPAPGIVPDLDAELHQHGPVYFVEQGIQIDVPMLLRQGASDNLFNLNQGLDIFNKALTDEAREDSYFVSFNGGHALPNVAPRGEPATFALGGGADACSEDWNTDRIAFFKGAFSGEGTEGIYAGTYNFTGLDSASCVSTEVFDTEELVVDPTGTGVIATPTGGGAPLHIELADGPTTITGVPTLSGLATALGIDSRAFFGLSVGTSPADAAVIDNNLMPLRVLRQSVDRPFEIELPGVSVSLEEGEKLFLTITPVSDMFFGHGSRVPTGLVLSSVELTLPVPGVEEVVDEVLDTVLTLTREGQGSSSRLVANLTDSTGAPVQAATISFTSAGEDLGTANTDETGTAVLYLTGKHRSPNNTYEATYAGGERYKGSSAQS
jgi:ABC-2 type transport system ATP-binding protein